MWLSWDQLKSVRFNYIFVCFLCSQRSSQFPPAPISSSLLSLFISGFWPCVGTHRSLMMGGDHLQFDNYSGCFWCDLPPALSPESEDLGGRMPLRLILDLLLKPHIQVVSFTSPDLASLFQAVRLCWSQPCRRFHCLVLRELIYLLFLVFVLKSVK